MRIAARPSPESAARSKNDRAEAMSPAPRKASPRAIRAGTSPAESCSPPPPGRGTGSAVDRGADAGPGELGPVVSDSNVGLPAEATFEGAMATFTEDKPTASGDGTAVTPAGAA